MAEIAVERKSAFPWWAWLLIALAVAILAWMFFVRGREGTETERQRSGEALTSLNAFYNVQNTEALVGRPVNVQNARVLTVSGDSTFWIGEGEGQQVLVRLRETATPGTPGVEGRYDVNPGQRVSIVDGEVKAFPGWEAARTQWNADPALRSNYENQKVYIEATRLELMGALESNQPVEAQPR